MGYKPRLLDKMNDEEILEILRSCKYDELIKFTRIIKRSKALTEKILFWYIDIRMHNACLTILCSHFPDSMVNNFCLKHPIAACNVFYNRLKDKDIDSVVAVSPINANILLLHHPYYIKTYLSNTNKINS